MSQYKAQILNRIEKQVKAFPVPSVTGISFAGDPYKVLVSCMLSLRTRDQTTIEASLRLFKQAGTVKKIARLGLSQLEKLIYPVGFYRNKAKAIKSASVLIIEKFGGKVPDSLEELLTLPGVGRKTANLVLGLGFHIPAICVDTHVHRITNRMGWVVSTSPEETEESLKNIIPVRDWIKLNTVLVAFGQNICLPLSPFCSRCTVRAYCQRTGVDRSR